MNLGETFSNLGGILTAVCGVGCVCLGVVGLVAAFLAIRVGGQFIPMISELVTGGRGANLAENPIVAQSAGRSAGDSIRQRAQLLKAQDPLGGSAPQSQSFQSQAAPPTAQSGGFPAFNPGQAASPPSNQPTLLPPSRATGQFGALGRQQPLQPPPSSVPPRGNYPAFNPPGAVQPPSAPLGGIPRRPSLSGPRPVSPLDKPTAPGDRFDTGEVPGLRNRRRRADDTQEIYDDEGDDGFGGLGNMLGL